MKTYKFNADSSPRLKPVAFSAEAVKVGIIGCGRIGALLETEYPGEHWGYDKLRETPCTHIGAYKALPNDVEVEAVCDVDIDKAKAVAKKWKVPNFYSSYKRMMQLHKFDVVSVATPAKTHVDIVGYLAQTGRVKLIFCEKPLASSLEDATRMVSVCRLNDVILAVNHTRRWSDTYRKIKEIIDSKTYGDLVKVVGFASREKDFQGNIHMFDILNYLTDNNRDLQTYIDCYPTDYLIFELEVILSQGKIQVLHNGRQVIVYEKKSSLHYSGINELVASQALQPYSFSEALRNAVRNIVQCIKSGGQQPLCVGDMGLEALQSYLEWRKRK